MNWRYQIYQRVTATHCNTLQHMTLSFYSSELPWPGTATHCNNTLQQYTEESRPTWNTWLTSKSPDTYRQWHDVMSHIWISDITHVTVYTHSYVWCDAMTPAYVMSHIWISDITHLNVLYAYHTLECVKSNLKHSRHASDMPHIQISHITHVKKSRHTNKRVMLHVCMSHVRSETRHTHQWVMSHMKMSQILRGNESGETHVWITAHSQIHTQFTNQPEEQQRIKHGT